jgi:hypothetical protein
MNAKMKDTLFGLLRSESVHDAKTRATLESTPSARKGIRLTPLQVRLLTEFVNPNSAHAVAQSSHWCEEFGEPVSRVLRTLKEQGLLIEPTDPRARMCHARDESDLRLLCLECGLDPTGSGEQLVDRLLAVDPTGWLMGYTGEMLQCSESAALMMASGKEPVQLPIEQGDSDNDAVWQTLTRHALITAHEGNLVRCRNVHLTMANYLLRRSEHEKGLRALYIVCIFDLCGVRNRGDAPGGSRESYSRFDAARASLVPGLVRRVRDLGREMSLSVHQMHEIFLSVTARLPLPKESRRLWTVIEFALEGGLDLHDAVQCRRVIRNMLEGS